MTLGIEGDKNFQRTRAKVPLTELYNCSNTLRSLTQGCASDARRFPRYSAALVNIPQKLIQAAQE